MFKALNKKEAGDFWACSKYFCLMFSLTSSSCTVEASLQTKTFLKWLAKPVIK